MLRIGARWHAGAGDGRDGHLVAPSGACRLPGGQGLRDQPLPLARSLAISRPPETRRRGELVLSTLEKSSTAATCRTSSGRRSRRTSSGSPGTSTTISSGRARRGSRSSPPGSTTSGGHVLAPGVGPGPRQGRPRASISRRSCRSSGAATGALVAVVGREKGQLLPAARGPARGGRRAVTTSSPAARPGRLVAGRYQRHIEKLVADHLRAVAEELDRSVRQLGRSKVVLVGSEETRAEFERRAVPGCCGPP